MSDHLQSAKEVVRHLLYRIGRLDALRLIKRFRGLPLHHLAEGGLEGRFSAIHRDRVWSGDGSVSGPGSDVRATEALQDELRRVLLDLGASRVTDIGCGDFGWMQRVIGDINYCGVDIVPGLVSDLNTKYGRRNRCFVQLDATTDRLPGGDVAICREVLFHLSFADARALLDNLRSHEYEYLIATSDTAIWFNSDVPSGDYRPMNLRLPPFRFPDPLQVIEDGRVVRGRILGAWSLSDTDRQAL